MGVSKEAVERAKALLRNEVEAQGAITRVVCGVLEDMLDALVEPDAAEGKPETAPDDASTTCPVCDGKGKVSPDEHIPEDFATPDPDDPATWKDVLRAVDLTAHYFCSTVHHLTIRRPHA